MNRRQFLTQFGIDGNASVYVHGSRDEIIKHITRKTTWIQKQSERAYKNFSAVTRYFCDRNRRWQARGPGTKGLRP